MFSTNLPGFSSVLLLLLVGWLPNQGYRLRKSDSDNRGPLPLAQSRTNPESLEPNLQTQPGYNRCNNPCHDQSSDQHLTDLYDHLLA